MQKVIFSVCQIVLPLVGAALDDDDDDDNDYNRLINWLKLEFKIGLLLNCHSFLSCWFILSVTGLIP